jgi:hypothetical protein
MKRPLSMGIIVILLLLSVAPGTSQGASSSIALPPESSCLAIDLRLRLDDLDSAWNCRIVIDRVGLPDSPVWIANRIREPIDASQMIQKEVHTARSWLAAVRVLGRFVVRRIIRWIGSPDLH